MLTHWLTLISSVHSLIQQYWLTFISSVHSLIQQYWLTYSHSSVQHTHSLSYWLTHPVIDSFIYICIVLTQHFFRTTNICFCIFIQRESIHIRPVVRIGSLSNLQYTLILRFYVLFVLHVLNFSSKKFFIFWFGLMSAFDRRYKSYNICILYIRIIGTVYRFYT